jgi:hypothetical protein
VVLLEFRVKIYTELNQVISDETWYGTSLENVKYWVEKAVLELKGTYKDVYYEIVDIRKKH